MWDFFAININKNKNLLFYLIGNPKIVFKPQSIELINVIYYN